VVSGMPVRVKWGRWGGAVTSLAAEYEECCGVARRCGPPLLKDVTDAAEALAREGSGARAFGTIAALGEDSQASAGYRDKHSTVNSNIDGGQGDAAAA